MQIQIVPKKHLTELIHFISFSSDELGNEMHASLSQHAAVGDRRVLSQRHTNMALKYLIYCIRSVEP